MSERHKMYTHDLCLLQPAVYECLTLKTKHVQELTAPCPVRARIVAGLNVYENRSAYVTTGYSMLEYCRLEKEKNSQLRWDAWQMVD